MSNPQQKSNNIKRREFCLGLAGAAAFFSSEWLCRSHLLQALDDDPRCGYTLEDPRLFLFTDLRNIAPSSVRWRSPDGETTFHVAGPPEPPVEAVADPRRVPDGVRLQAFPAEKEGPLNVPNLVIFDNGRYRSWGLQVHYSGKDLGSYSKAEIDSVTVRYGESDDGYAWNWRDAGEVKMSGITGLDGSSFFIDEHGPEEQRYKCIYHAALLGGASQVPDLWQAYEKLHPRYRDIRINKDSVNCLFGMVSPDGIHWKAITQPLMIHKGDTDNTVYYDSWLGKYVLYTRLFLLHRRMVARAESDDFHHWSPVKPILGPRLDDPLYYDVYTNGRTHYPGLPSQHLMFPFFYNRYSEGSEIYLHSSLDGIEWNRVPGGPVITMGDPGNWDGGFICNGKNLVPLGKDKIALPYSGTTHPHKYPRWDDVIKGGSGWATWPKERFSAVVADESGEFYTFEHRVTGKRLRINAQVRRAGEIRIGLKRVSGRSINDCDPFTGNSLDHIVTWKGNSDVAVELGENVTLHFKLRLAKLFAFEWI